MNSLLHFACFFLSSLIINANTIPPVPTDEIDEVIYNMVELTIKEIFPYDEHKIRCMVDDIKKNKIVDRFYTREILDDRDALKKEIEVYSLNAEANCSIASLSSRRTASLLHMIVLSISMLSLSYQ